MGDKSALHSAGRKQDRGQFKAGKSGNPRGRVRGVPNKVTREIRELATKLVTDTTYVARLKKRLNGGRIAPAIEVLLWHYAYGKPKDTVEVVQPDKILPEPLAMSTEEIKKELVEWAVTTLKENGAADLLIEAHR